MYITYSFYLFCKFIYFFWHRWFNPPKTYFRTLQVQKQISGIPLVFAPPPLPPFRTLSRGGQKPVGLSNYSIIILIISKSMWKSSIYLKILQKSSKITLKWAKILSKSVFFIRFSRIEIRTKIRIFLLKIWLSLNRGGGKNQWNSTDPRFVTRDAKRDCKM